MGAGASRQVAGAVGPDILQLDQVVPDIDDPKTGGVYFPEGSGNTSISQPNISITNRTLRTIPVAASVAIPVPPQSASLISSLSRHPQVVSWCQNLAPVVGMSYQIGTLPEAWLVNVAYQLGWADFNSLIAHGVMHNGQFNPRCTRIFPDGHGDDNWLALNLPFFRGFLFDWLQTPRAQGLTMKWSYLRSHIGVMRNINHDIITNCAQAADRNHISHFSDIIKYEDYKAEIEQFISSHQGDLPNLCMWMKRYLRHQCGAVPNPFPDGDNGFLICSSYEAMHVFLYRNDGEQPRDMEDWLRSAQHNRSDIYEEFDRRLGYLDGMDSESSDEGASGESGNDERS